MATIGSIMTICVFWPVRHPTMKITAAMLAKWLRIIALLFLIAVFMVIAAPMVSPISSWLICVTTLEEPTSPNGLELYECVEDLLENGVDVELETDVNSGGLLTAAATIMGLTVFGSALGTLGSSKDSIKGVAYILLPTLTVQAVFMLHLVNITYFPVEVWIPMTAILLMLVVLAVAANKIAPD